MSRSTTRRRRLSSPQNTPGEADSGSSFQITHPFHPAHGQRFSVVTVRHNWGEQLIYYRDRGGQLRSISEGWTDLGPPDPFVTISAGRSPFRLQDLLELVCLVAVLTREAAHGR